MVIATKATLMEFLRRAGYDVVDIDDDSIGIVKVRIGSYFISLVEINAVKKVLQDEYLPVGICIKFLKYNIVEWIKYKLFNKETWSKVWKLLR